MHRHSTTPDRIVTKKKPCTASNAFKVECQLFAYQQKKIVRRANRPVVATPKEKKKILDLYPARNAEESRTHNHPILLIPGVAEKQLRHFFLDMDMLFLSQGFSLAICTDYSGEYSEDKKKPSIEKWGGTT